MSMAVALRQATMLILFATAPAMVNANQKKGSFYENT
jgi:hypothetical protein